jgi:hypothetical protein
MAGMNKQPSIGQMLHQLQTRVNCLEGRVNHLEGRANYLEGRAMQMEGRVTYLEAELQRADANFTILANYSAMLGSTLLRQGLTVPLQPQLWSSSAIMTTFPISVRCPAFYHQLRDGDFQFIVGELVRFIDAAFGGANALVVGVGADNSYADLVVQNVPKACYQSLLVFVTERCERICRGHAEALAAPALPESCETPAAPSQEPPQTPA